MVKCLGCISTKDANYEKFIKAFITTVKKSNPTEYSWIDSGQGRSVSDFPESGYQEIAGTRAGCGKASQIDEN